MNLSDIITKCYILALFIRDDGERLLLGDGFFEFKESLQHFQPNTFVNDVVELQGTDGQLLAGQVRRTAVQTFEGYIGDGTIGREQTETNRRRFLQFFRKKHFYTVVYILPDGSAVQRNRGYIVNAPSAPELYQRFPEYSVGLNFEDPNYYEYDEDSDGDEIPAHSVVLSIANLLEGGLIWDAFGAVSNEKTWLDWENGITVDGLYTFSNGLAGAPLEFTQLDGNATQETTTGKNLFGASQGSRTDNGVTSTISDGIITLKNTTTAAGTIGIGNQTIDYTPEGGDTYTFTIWLVSGSATFTLPDDCGFYIRKPDGTSYATGASLMMSRIRQYGYQTTTFTAPDATPMRFLISANKAGITFNNVVLRVQVEKSSSRTDWEPYTGKTASPSPSYPQTVNVVSNEQNVRITKKNRLPNPADWSQNVNGLQVDCVNGAYKLQGKATSGSSTSLYYLNEPYTVRPGDYFHLGNTIIDSHVNVQFLFADGIGNGIVGSPSEIGRIISLDQYAGRTLNRVRCNFNANFDLDIEMKPMILHNITTATEFEPYQSANYYLNLGKNLACINTSATKNIGGVDFTIENGVIKVASGTTSSSGNFYFDTFRVLSGESSFWMEISGYTPAPSDNCTYVLQESSDNGSTWSNAAQMSFASPSTQHPTLDASKLYRIRWYAPPSVSFNNAQIKFMLEYGSTATSFAPYFTPIELAKIGNYKNAFKRIDGVWYKHTEIGKVVLDGTETNWSGEVYGGLWRASRVFSDIAPIALSTDFVGMSNHFRKDAGVLSSNMIKEGMFCQYRNTSSVYFAAPSSAQTSAEWKTWLSAHNTTVYYALATATDTQITEPELLSQLNGIASTFDGVNNITITPSAGAQGELSVHYATGSIDVGAGYEWEEGSDTGTNVIVNNGIDSVFPTWIVPGPATNPTLTNITTGQTIVWEGSVASGQTLTVDLNRQTAELGGTNVFAQLSGDWVKLAPGPNKLAYSATGATEGCRLEWNGVVG